MTYIPGDKFVLRGQVNPYETDTKSTCSPNQSSINPRETFFVAQTLRNNVISWSWSDLYKENPLPEPKSVDAEIKNGIPRIVSNGNIIKETKSGCLDPKYAFLSGYLYYETEYFKIFYLSKDEYNKIRDFYNEHYKNNSSNPANGQSRKEELPEYKVYLEKIKFLAARLDNCPEFQNNYLLGKSTSSEKIEVYYAASEEDEAKFSLAHNISATLIWRLKSYAKCICQTSSDRDEIKYWKEIISILNSFPQDGFDWMNRLNHDEFLKEYRLCNKKGDIFCEEFCKKINGPDRAKILSKIFQIKQEDMQEICAALSKMKKRDAYFNPEITLSAQPQTLLGGFVMSHLWPSHLRPEDGPDMTLGTPMHELGHLMLPDREENQEICTFLGRMAHFYRPKNKDKAYNFYKDPMFFTDKGNLKSSTQEMKNNSHYIVFILSYLNQEYGLDILSKILQKFYEYHWQDKRAMEKAICEILKYEKGKEFQNFAEFEKQLMKDISKSQF